MSEVYSAPADMVWEFFFMYGMVYGLILNALIWLVGVPPEILYGMILSMAVYSRSLLLFSFSRTVMYARYSVH